MITVKCFASIEEQIGKHSLEFDFENTTVSKIIDLIEQRHAISLDSVMIAVNEEYANLDTMVKPGDIIALIPPVSGG
ncbi:MoaD/ThiS family protein [Alkalicoccobacillus gibsonii]|uniref:MoaD/ThiS family protein n=1 Tax=Alkalicoccobacillus gibsonii TaxID=79881 RepID=UPI003F7C097B